MTFADRTRLRRELGVKHLTIADMPERLDPVKAQIALWEFVDTMNVTGGVVERDGWYYPVGEPEWGDLGSAYMDACDAFGVAPVIEVEP